jgi:hypothetical protein
MTLQTKILNVGPNKIDDETVSVERVASVGMEMASIMFSKTNGPIEAVAAAHVVVRCLIAELREVEGLTQEEAREVLALGTELAAGISILARETDAPVASQSGGEA